MKNKNPGYSYQVCKVSENWPSTETEYTHNWVLHGIYGLWDRIFIYFKSTKTVKEFHQNCYLIYNMFTAPNFMSNLCPQWWGFFCFCFLNVLVFKCYPKTKQQKNDLFFFTGHFIFKQWEFSVITEHCYCHKSTMRHLMLHKVNNKSWAHWSVGGNGTLCSWVQSCWTYTQLHWWLYTAHEPTYCMQVAEESCWAIHLH